MFKRPKSPDAHVPAWDRRLEATALTLAAGPRIPEQPTGRHAIYEVGDFASLESDQVAELRERAEADDVNGLRSCAHLVVTCDVRTGLVTHHVPCSDGREALQLAEQIVAEKRTEDPEFAFTVKVTPLLPHSDQSDSCIVVGAP